MAKTIQSRRIDGKTEKAIFTVKLRTIIQKYHKRNIDKIIDKLNIKVVNVKNSMYSRSKKYNVRCNITIEEIRNLIIEHYGKPCKYDKSRILTYKNIVFDHIIPMSKGGESTLDNIQVISKFSNSLKGSLDEVSFYKLLNWLNSIDPELKKDISIRLAHGIH